MRTHGVEQFCVNIQWQYALNSTNGSDVSSYVSLKSLWTMRHLLSQEGMQQVLFDRVCQKLADVFRVDVQHQRIDAVHIQSTMRHLGRISVFGKTIRKFLTNLKRYHKNLLLSPDTELVDRYPGNKQEAAFGAVKPSDPHAVLSELAQDLYALIRTFTTISAVRSMSSFTLLVHLFNEQCIPSGSGNTQLRMCLPTHCRTLLILMLVTADRKAKGIRCRSWKLMTRNPLLNPSL